VIYFSVDDLDAACKRFEDLGVNWKKRLTDGRMKNVAFVLDPDNYCKFSGSIPFPILCYLGG
jgi:lactoylglutathione lyase